MNTPTIETERLILRKFTLDDLEAIYQIYSDEEVNRFLPWFPLRNREQARRLFEEKYAALYAMPWACAYAICLKQDNLPIGYIQVGMEEPHDLGYGLRREFWHRGIVTEAAKAVVAKLKQDGLPYNLTTLRLCSSIWYPRSVCGPFSGAARPCVQQVHNFFLMKIRFLLSLAATVAAVSAYAQTTNVMKLRVNRPLAPVQPTMYGIFIEDINFAADGGLYAELVKNRSFEFPDHLQGWRAAGRFELRDDGPFERNPHYLRLLYPGHPHKYTALENEGFFGIGLKEGADNRLAVADAAASGRAFAILLPGSIQGDGYRHHRS